MEQNTMEEQNTVEMQIDEHLDMIHRNTKAALVRLDKSGVKVDRKFLNYFQKLSVER